MPFFYCITALIMIFVVYDLFDNLPDFIQHSIKAGYIAWYYVMLLPYTTVVIMPWALLLAILYCMAIFARNNEITAMRSSGISVVRIAQPLLIVGFLFSIAMLLLNELVVPTTMRRTERFVRTLEHPDEPVFRRVEVLGIRNQRDRRTWLIRDFDPETGKTGEIEVTQEDPSGRKVWTARAESAVYRDGRWWFFDGIVQPYNENGLPVQGRSRKPTFQKREMVDLTEDPNLFLNEIRVEREPEKLSSMELLSYLEMHGRDDDIKWRRASTMLHYRLASPWTCLMVILIGIPCGVRTNRRGAALGVASAVGVVVVYYFAVQTAFALGKSGTIPPWIAGWLPNLLFGAGGILLLYRVR